MSQNKEFTEDKEFVSKAQKKKEKKSLSNKLNVKTIVLRSLLCLGTVVICVLVAAITLLYVLVNGGCEPLRDRLVLSATQASATKWLPGLFMPQSEVDKIVEQSYIVNTDVMSLDEYMALAQSNNDAGADEWENAVDGMVFE